MESNNKVIYVNQPYQNLESLFKSPIKQSEKERYDTVLFLQLKITSLMIKPVQESLMDQNKMITFLIDFVGMNQHEAYQFSEALVNAFETNTLNPVEKLVLSINSISSLGNTFNLLPKSGFFCTRSEIAKKWLKSFVIHSGLQSKEMGVDFITIWFQNLWRYLLAYHNDVFFIKKSETENDAGFRIINELVEIVKNRSNLISNYSSK